MKNNFLNLMLFIMMAFSFFSCEKFNEYEDIDNNKEANSVLIIRTRASTETNEENTEISYPVNIYVFDENDACTGVTSIESADEQISFKLPEGSYNVYAIAGAAEEDYNLPVKENAKKETIVNLKEGKQHGDLMTAHNTVNLTYGEENILTLLLARKVMLIETVTIDNVPSNVTAVSVEIGPLYDNILLNGSYTTDKNSSQTITLTKEGDSKKWTNTLKTYILEAAGPATIKVSLTTDEGTKSYSYSSTEELKANYKININGTYKDNGIILNGTIKGTTWAGTIDISFNFEEDGSTEGKNPNGGTGGENQEEPDGNTPKVGSLYENCYVLMSEKTENGTKVTLMSTGYKDKIVFTQGDQASMTIAIDEQIAELADLATKEISGWRLPTLAEIEYIRNNLKTINDNLQKNNLQNIFTGSYLYYFTTEDGNISTYSLDDGRTIDNPSSGKSSYILRAFTTITFAN